MTQKTFSRIGLYFTIGSTIYILTTLIWEHFHGGVSGHNLLKRKELPNISNWWGAILLPLVSYISFAQIRKRIDFNSDFTSLKFTKQHVVPFLIAMLYGVLIVVFSSTDNSNISYLMFMGLFFVALFLPIYYSEYVLGFILGLSYAFGGALPVVIAAVLATIYFLIFNYIRVFFIFIGRKIGIYRF